MFYLVPAGYWDDKKNHRIEFDKIAKLLNFKSMEDWYSVSSHTLEEHTSISFMRMYDRYTYKAVMSIYPGMQMDEL